MRGRKPVPVALRRNGKASSTPVPATALPRCPSHLSHAAQKEWRRLARPLHDMGVLSVVDRGALAAYCQAWGRWVEAEQKLKETPLLLKTPSGYVQQSPWLSVSNKQLELMGRYMAELGLTPVSRTRLTISGQEPSDVVATVRFVTVCEDCDGKVIEERADPPASNPDTAAVRVRRVR